MRFSERNTYRHYLTFLFLKVLFAVAVAIVSVVTVVTVDTIVVVAAACVVTSVDMNTGLASVLNFASALFGKIKYVYVYVYTQSERETNICIHYLSCSNSDMSTKIKWGGGRGEELRKQ